MGHRTRIATASAMLLTTFAGLHTQAAETPDPPPSAASTIRLAAAPPGALKAQNTPANEGSSSGEGINPSNSTVGGQTLAETALPEPPRSGPLYGVGSYLLNHGINLHPTFLDQFWANPSAGIVKGQTYNLGVLGLNADVDLQRLAGVAGGNIHVSYNVVMFKSNIPAIISDAGGFLTGYQTTPALADSKLSLLTYEQKVFNDRLSLEVGRTNLYRYFLLNNSLDPFTAASSTFSVVADAVPFINPTWGGRAKYNVGAGYYVQVGAFEDFWRRSIVRPWNLDTDGAYGVQILAELGYRSEFDTAAYPGNFEVGAEGNTRNGYSNFKGTARPSQVVVTVRNRTITTNFTAADYSGGEVLFAQGKKVVWRGADNPGGQPRNIAVFGSADVSLDKPQPIDFDMIGGVDFTGFIPGRPADALEFQIHYQRLSQIEANFETASQIKTTGPGSSQSRNNFAFQLTGNVQATSAIAVRPFVQYFTNADSYYVPTGRSHDGWGAGLITSISFGRLLGISPL